MTAEEIFSLISAHMVEGLMFHAQMADYYCFLGLKGYSKCHEYHYLSESCNFRKLSKYYLKHYNKLIASKTTTDPKAIPDSWFKYTRQDVDINTRKSSIQAGQERWVKWENDTKIYYSKMYQELMVIGDVAGAMELKKYIEDVDDELAEAKQRHLETKAIDFNISDIMNVQEELYKKYSKKMK